VDGGIYTLILLLEKETRLVVGALAEIYFSRGCYCYTGSARSSSGFQRIQRHLAVMRGSNPARRWHIDYLLPHTTLAEAVMTPTDMDLECFIARKIGAALEDIPGFGCSDCACSSHLHRSGDLEAARRAVLEAHRSAMLELEKGEDNHNDEAQQG
jgi:endonuclease-3